MRSRRLRRLIAILTLAALAGIGSVLYLVGNDWTPWDYKLLDRYYGHAVKSGKGAALSPDIVLLLVTDASMDFFRKNALDRTDLAGVNRVLSALDPRAVAYDMIFARPSLPEADTAFADSLSGLGSVYLPVALAPSAAPVPFKWQDGIAYRRLRTEHLGSPREGGTPRPVYARRAVMQMDAFSAAAIGSGHITATADADGVFRHLILLMRIGDRYLPTLSLAMYLDAIGSSLDEIGVDWGRCIRIPASKKNGLKKDLLIPIDETGRTYIPFAGTWSEDFPKMEVQTLLGVYRDDTLRGNLLEFFEGKFVFVGDISLGASDMGDTPLEAGAPLIMMHTALLNGLLTQTFYRKWSLQEVFGLISLIGLLLAGSALFNASWPLYAAAGLAGIGILGWTWVQMVHFRLFPVATVLGGSFLIFLSLIIGIQTAVSRERSFIKHAFSKYVPTRVVNELLSNPHRLQLGGEERVMTVLFSDLADFTSVSENLSPSDLVCLINAYLTEMTGLILEAGGIIDKYEGDAIMAEFGAPLPVPDHADRAVHAALMMQTRLAELRKRWWPQGLPALRSRIGINTGTMIIGNMGSDQVFDYTVMGDAVNLASRLESANKRYGTELMISEATFRHLTPGRFRTRMLDVIRVKGKSEAVTVYEVCGETNTPV